MIIHKSVYSPPPSHTRPPPPLPQSPPKGATIPYRPKAQVGNAASPVLFAGSQNFALPGGFGLPSAAGPDVSTGQLPFLAGAPPAGGHSSPPVIAPHTPLPAHMSPHFLDAKAGHILLPSLPPTFPDVSGRSDVGSWSARRQTCMTT